MVYDRPSAFLSTGFQSRCRTGINTNNDQLLVYWFPTNALTHLRLGVECDGCLTPLAFSMKGEKDERADLRGRENAKGMILPGWADPSAKSCTRPKL